MWTQENRLSYERQSSRYASDLSDAEWELVEPHLPPPRKGRRYPAPERRDVLDAILYVLTTGCQWRQLPKDFPPKSTVHRYFLDWHLDGILAKIHHALYTAAREAAGRNAEPTLGIVDSQSVKSAEKGASGSTRRVTMLARKSKAKSVMFVSILKV